VAIAGAALVGLGALVLLFIVFQLWGTAIVQSAHQSSLRAQIEDQLPRAAAADAARLETTPERHAGGPASPAPAGAAPAEGQPVAIIEIPKIDVDQVVIEGVAAPDLALGPGHYPGTPLPGQAGNAGIAGHRTTHGRPFYDLQALTPGDQVTLMTRQGIFVYSVTRSSVVDPTDVSVLDPSPVAELTLTTCNPRFSAAQRLVVQATLARSLLFPAVFPPAGRRPFVVGSSIGDDLLAGTGSGGAGWALLWGVATVLVAVGVVLAARRGRPVVVYAVGIPVVLVVLFVFFAALDPLLPASL